MQFDDSKWPLIIGTVPRIFGPETVAAFERAFDGYFARTERFALIIDTRPVVQLPDAVCRKAIATWANSPAVKLGTARHNVGTAVVIASQLARYGMTAMTWILKTPSPQLAVASMGEAVEWCCRLLEKAGVPLSATLVEYRSSVQNVA